MKEGMIFLEQKDSFMVEKTDWRNLLYPAEWGLRFFIAGALVWLIGQQWHDVIVTIAFYILGIGLIASFVLQMWVMKRNLHRIFP